jgi:predicted dehydrogenase
MKKKESLTMEAIQTQRLRYAIIGIGAGILNAHRPALALPIVDLVAASDIDEAKGQQRASELNCAFYTDYKQMLAEIKPDVAIIMTPPFLHAEISIDCLQAGCHVLVEKPMALQVAEADKMIETAQRWQRLLGVVFQHRFRPEVIAARKLLQEGIVGHIQRAELTAVWTRPTSYYAMAPWRATWTGEGGGILTNQSSHNLDLLCHLLGSPVRVFAWTRQLLHQIETEDTVHAMLEWSNGTLASVHISTAEADDPERLKMIGTRGMLEISRGTLAVQTLDADMHEYAVNTQNPYTQPTKHPYPVTVEQGQNGFIAVYHNFHETILQGDYSTSHAKAARMELELANAMVYSSYNHCETELPLDRQRYSTLLKSLQQHSAYNPKH